MNLRIGTMENQIETNKDEMKKIEREITRNNKNIEILKNKFNKHIEITVAKNSVGRK